MARVAGLGVAVAAIRGLEAMGPLDQLRVESIGIDGTVLLYTFAIAVATGLIFGFAPALQGSRADLQHSLKDGTRTVSDHRGHWIRKGLVVAEIALALTLLVGAGLLIRSFARLQQVDPGFDPSHLLTFNISLPESKYKTDAERIAFFEAVSRDCGAAGHRLGGRDIDHAVQRRLVDGQFLGRGLSAAERDAKSVGRHAPGDARLSRNDEGSAGSAAAPSPPPIARTARRSWSSTRRACGGSGRRAIRSASASRSATIPSRDEWITVVGVVEHAAHEGLDAEHRVQLYFPFTQNPPANMSIALRTAGPPADFGNAARAAVRAVDRDQPIADVKTMDEMMDRAVGQRWLSMMLLGAFGALALLLAAIGIYGVMSFDVTRRSQEIGVRMALGAARGSVLSLVFRQGFVLAVSGIVIGLVCALALTRVLQAQLFGVGRTDPGHVHRRRGRSGSGCGARDPDSRPARDTRESD